MVESVTMSRRWIPTIFTTHKTLIAALWIALIFTGFLWQKRDTDFGFFIFRRTFSHSPFPKLRPVCFNLTEFGAIGDGSTVNTEAFEKAMRAVSKLGKKGGAQINVPPGRWLTAPFNLTSHLTLFLAEGAEILGITVVGGNQIKVLESSATNSFLYLSESLRPMRKPL